MKTRKNNLNLLFIFLSLSFRGHPGIVWSTIPGLSICGKASAANSLTSASSVFFLLNKNVPAGGT